MKKRIVITGGHLSPAVAIIQKLRSSDWEIFFAGRKYAFLKDENYSFEYQTIKELKVHFVDISPVRLKKEITLSNIVSMLFFPMTIVKSAFLLRKIKPDCLLTFGGYVGLPVCLAAVILNIPFIIHEQTVRPGKANISLARFAAKIFIGWEEAKKYFPLHKTVLIGNPLRQEIGRKSGIKWLLASFKPNLPLVYLTGGSTGAHNLNIKIGRMLPRLLEFFTVIHQCGESYYQDFNKLQIVKKSLIKKYQNRYHLFKYLKADETNDIFNKADIIIGRAGANTVCEIAVLGKTAVFVPHPYSSFAEQRWNAKKIAEQGSAYMIEEKDINQENLLKLLLKIRDKKSILDEKAYQYSRTKEIQNHLHAASKMAHFFNHSFPF